MSNTFFQFKQFTIHQDACAMKVCTDSCLFGAWLANSIKDIPMSKALDIGSGTGLLSLMLAQEKDVQIDAIEIDESAVLQSIQNVESTDYRDRIEINHLSLLDFEASNFYDLIFSNPPFFEKDLLSGNSLKNAAKHDTTLTLSFVIKFMQENLAIDGFGALLLPHHRRSELETLLIQHDLFILKILQVRQTNRHDFFRIMVTFSKKKIHEPITEEMSIRIDNGEYSESFKTLLKPYYLNL